MGQRSEFWESYSMYRDQWDFLKSALVRSNSVICYTQGEMQMTLH